MLQITARPQFRHSGTLLGPTRDPREQRFYEADVVIDLRGCEFIWPAAVLWCVVYPILVRTRGSKCRVLVPEDTGVCIHLKSLGVFELLQNHGVEVDDRGIDYRPMPQVVLPVTGFNSANEVEQFADQALERLSTSGLGAINLRPLVSETFAELGLNAVQHAESPVGGFGLIQFFDSTRGSRFVCTVADGGVGIRRSLERNPDLRSRVFYDWDAIELSVRERVSGTGNAHRGIGLYGVAEDMRAGNRSLIIHSGIGLLQIGEDIQMQAKRSKLFPGTLVSASIPT